jgi:DeoR family fructose operon transcriptional repressor
MKRVAKIELNNVRQAQMKELITSLRSVTVQELIDRFKVSDMTIRRDLAYLEELGVIKRVHGGAIYIEDGKLEDGPEEDIPVSVREDMDKHLKQRIARKAVSFIQEGDSILLDAGSTTLEIARELLLHKNITVITNALNISLLLTQNQNIQIIMASGDVRHPTQSTVGPATIDFLKTFQVEYAFIGCSGLSCERGLTNSNMAEGAVKRTMMKIANNVCVVADHTKFNHSSFNRFASLDDVDTIITTQELDEKILNQLKERHKPEILLV